MANGMSLEERDIGTALGSTTGQDCTHIRLTSNMLKKNTLDASVSVRKMLAKYGIVSFDAINPGLENKVLKPALLCTPKKPVDTSASFYRPSTKSGTNKRFWVSALDHHAKAGDLLWLSCWGTKLVALTANASGMHAVQALKDYCVTRTPDPGIKTPEEATGKYREGAVKQVLVNRYERDPDARRACINFHGWACSVCGIKLEDVYGDLGRDYIHVHHLKPLASIGVNYQVDPIEDLRPVCPNCHAMLHRQTPPLEIRDLKNAMKGKA